MSAFSSTTSSAASLSCNNLGKLQGNDDLTMIMEPHISSVTSDVGDDDMAEFDIGEGQKASRGQLKSYNEETGFGFITCDAITKIFGRDVFIHKAQAEGLKQGDEVEFFVELNKNGMPQARDVKLLFRKETVPVSVNMVSPNTSNSTLGSMLSTPASSLSCLSPSTSVTYMLQQPAVSSPQSSQHFVQHIPAPQQFVQQPQIPQSTQQVVYVVNTPQPHISPVQQVQQLPQMQIAQPSYLAQPQLQRNFQQQQQQQQQQVMYTPVVFQMQQQ